MKRPDFVAVWTNENEYYRVGVDRKTGDKVIEIVITSIGWYSVFFKLTQEEFSWYQTNVDNLNDLARQFASDQGREFFADRLIFTEKPGL